VSGFSRVSRCRFGLGNEALRKDFVALRLLLCGVLIVCSCASRWTILATVHDAVFFWEQCTRPM